MKLHLALTHHDLAYRFGVSNAIDVRIFKRYIDAFYDSLYPTLVKWPDRETLWETMPENLESLMEIVLRLLLSALKFLLINLHP